MDNMTSDVSNPAVTARKWIGEISAERVGRIWRPQDHEALSRTIRAADELTLALVALARSSAAEECTNGTEEVRDGEHETQPVGSEAHANSH